MLSQKRRMVGLKSDLHKEKARVDTFYPPTRARREQHVRPGFVCSVEHGDSAYLLLPLYGCLILRSRLVRPSKGIASISEYLSVSEYSRKLAQEVHLHCQ